MSASLLLLIALVGAHFVFDYPLQGDFLSKAKNRFDKENIYRPVVPWYQAMVAHCFMHAAAVFLLTGVWWLGLCEFVIHFITDDTKCKGKISFNQDQAIHIGCKLMWWSCVTFIFHKGLFM